MKYSPTDFINKMEKHDFNLKKMYGQNFIIDENIIDSIIKKSDITKDTLVIEIGPGAGSLTYKLAKYAGNVLCYEIDSKLKNLLNENLIDCSNVKIIFKDFLKSDVLNDIKEYNSKKIYVVSNLPYYITTPIIGKIIEDKLPIDKMVLMVQKEVGERFNATPGSREYNSLSIYVNYYFDVKKLLDVSRNVFIPRPNVDSIVVEFLKKEKNYNIKNEEIFFKLVKDSFKQKRKTLKNNLKDYDFDKIEKILKKHNFDSNVRAEQLPIQVFVDISNSL